MARINNHLLNLPRDYRNNGSPPLVRTYSHHSIDSHSVPIIIDVSGSFESERFFGGYLDRETPFNESSSDTLLSIDNIGGNCTVNYVSVPSTTIGNLYFRSQEMEFASLNKEDTQIVIKNYHTILSRI